MRHPRYIAILGNRDPFGARRMVEERAAATGLPLVFKTDGLCIFCAGSTTPLPDPGQGIILGAIRRSASTMPDFIPTSEESAAILRTRGDYLIDTCWGDYVAFIAAPGGDAIVIRPPFTDLGCVHAEFEGLRVVADSSASLARCTRRTSTPDWDMVANHLLTVGLRQPRTCLSGIEELLWGARLVAGPHGSSLEECWSPWRFAARREHSPLGELTDRLQAVTVQSIGAVVRSMDHVAVMLSGGLDSSILAASVAASGTRLTCVTLTSGDAAGDERLFAGLVAAHLGSSLHEAEHRLDEVDIARSEAAHLARPIARSFAQASRGAKLRMAKAAGAQAVLDGGGGDNLFCYLQSAAPVADRIRRTGLGASTIGTAADIALLTETGIFKVLAMGMRRALRRSPRFRWELDERYLSAAAIERAGPASHAWLRAPARALPGSASHIAMMAVVEGLLETADGELPERAPLMNQPLVEFCLSIPSWNWFEKGHNRVVARRAFVDRLPRDIVWRRSKGSPDGFVARVFDTNRDKLRDLLCGGLLAAEGLLDRDAIERTLASSGPVKGHDHIRLLRVADVEAWVRSI